MGKKNWARYRTVWKVVALAASLLSPSATWAGQPNAAYLGTLQHMIGFDVPAIAAAMGNADAFRNKTTETLKARPQQVAVTPASPRLNAASQPNPVAVFQSVAFRVSSIPAARKWKAVFPLIASSDFARCETASSCAAAGILRTSIEDAIDLGFYQKLNRINRAVNRLVRYEADTQNYGSKDYWASPNEILTRGKGDCEDYAILKMAALKQAGLPPQAMSIVVLRDVRRNLYHAVLSVMTSQGYFILDNLSDEVKLDRALPTYQPLFSVSADRAWIHGIKTGGDKLASAASPSLDVMPGEGALR
ncbi:transglutaminase-like cysteine peptidase [Sinorhizobium sp. 8-89]|uniref:transglutaminase-like cysteine peptidase n=1 Tax=Sinorhizobium sp. 7-81 TaxID=3049087 RepID=UPI0024C29D18|nr:transglutaminase-like cysteine peptidase [Sinorhizobium sp. 7-81]MDK1387947.1 transglutaminase-like cysteine peptidase [Sinorhizobium sp. 7-81]